MARLEGREVSKTPRVHQLHHFGEVFSAGRLSGSAKSRGLGWRKLAHVSSEIALDLMLLSTTVENTSGNRTFELRPSFFLKRLSD